MNESLRLTRLFNASTKFFENKISAPTAATKAASGLVSRMATFKPREPLNRDQYASVIRASGYFPIALRLLTAVSKISGPLHRLLTAKACRGKKMRFLKNIFVLRQPRVRVYCAGSAKGFEQRRFLRVDVRKDCVSASTLGG
jgi:hypothetical protein